MITYTESNNNISMQDLIDLGLMGQDNSSNLRYQIQQKLHLGKGSAKTFLKRINMLNITLEELKKEVEQL